MKDKPKGLIMRKTMKEKLLEVAKDELSTKAHYIILEAVRQGMQQASDEHLGNANIHYAGIDALTAKFTELVQANRPDGWQIVPIEPTEEMIYAGRKAWPRYGYLNVISENIKSEYKAMLEAAPKPPIVETKLKMAIEALQAECGNRCNAEYNPCAAKQALEKIGE